MIWQNGTKGTKVFEEAVDAPVGGGGGNDGAAPKNTVTINGKEVDMATLASAHNLYESLSDPTVGKEIITQLARRTGILNDENLTTTPKAAEKQLEGKLTKMLKTKFGKDYDKFSDTLGPVLEDAMKEFMDEYKSESRATAAEGAWGNAVENFTETHHITDAISSQMEKLIIRNGGRPANLSGKESSEYLEDMYNLAVSKLGIDPEELEPKTSRRGQSRKTNDDLPEFREERRPSKVLTLDEIVDAAARGIKYVNR